MARRADDTSTDPSAREQRGSYVPFVVTLAHTLRASGEVLARAATRRLHGDDAERILRGWADDVLAAGDCTVTVAGREHVEEGRAYVVMSNHRSLLDAPALLRAMPGPLRMIGKAELAAVPVWGHAMRALGFVFIVRGNTKQSIAALEAAKAQVRAGTSVWIAPEGTRSRTGALLPFKKGGFHLAQQLGVPILPAWIEGTDRALRTDSFSVRRHQHVTVTFGAPVASEGSLDDVMARTRAAIESARAAAV